MEQVLNNKEIKEEEYALPPKKINKKKKSRIFSKAIFKESIKSNKKGLLITSIANGVLITCVIGILSTLNINSTSDALKNLFDNADLESTLKGGTVGYYQAFSSAASGYETLSSSLSTVQSSLNTALSTPTNSQVESLFSGIKTIYNTAYNIASGDDATKHSTAKATTMIVSETTINNSSLDEQTKAIAKLLVSDYLDEYHSNKSESNKDILIKTLPSAIASYIKTAYSIEDATVESLKETLNNAYSEVYTDNKSTNSVSISYSFQLADLVAGKMMDQETADTIFTFLSDEYNKNQTKYETDTQYVNSLYSTAIVEAAKNEINNQAYYAYLPSFEVKYITSELGWPVTYISTGKYDSNGNEIKQEIEIKTYNPSKFIVRSGDLGINANTAHKMRKEALTGTPYTEEEIQQAKDEAKESSTTLINDLNSFMKEYITRDENNENTYYKNSTVQTDAIEDLVTDKIVAVASDQLIEAYNEKYNESITSIDQISAEKNGLSGKSILNTVYSYTASSISSYKKIYKTKINEGYSTTDATLIANVTSSSGVMDQLPTKVNNSLTEMGDMNTYGIIVGMVGFAIAALLVPMAYTILLSNNLVAQKVENGSLAFTFSTPIKRTTFIFTEAVYLIFSETVMTLTLLVFALISREIGILCGGTDLITSLPVIHILKYTLGNYLVTLAISSICFLTSCYFNKTSYAIGVGGGISIFFFICAILGLFGTNAIPGTVRISAMNVFNYMTITSLFDAYSVMTGSNQYWYKLIGLVAISIVMYTSSIQIFKKKDLPL